MRLARRLALLVSVLLLGTSLSAPGAHADALRWGGAPVAAGFGLGLASTNVKIIGAFAPTLVCTSGSIGSTITTNNVAGMQVAASLNAFSWGGCALSMPLVSCTVGVNALPWPVGERLDFGPPKTLTVVFPTYAAMTITCSFGPPLGITTCTYTANTGVPPTDLPGAWTDSPPAAPAAVKFTAAPLRRIAPSAAACGAAASYTATYATATNSLTLTP